MTIDQLKEYLESFRVDAYEWDESYYSDRGLLLDINGNDNDLENEGIPSQAEEGCTISDERHTIHYALKHGLPMEYWYHIKIKNDYKMIDIRDLNFDVPMGETEDINQLGFLSRAFYMKFNNSDEFESYISSISVN